jgi:PAS domain S-box-containing protein
MRESDREARGARDDESGFRAIAEAFGLGIIERDVLGRTITVNPRWTEITGLTLETSTDAEIRARTHPDDRWVIAEWERILEARRSPFRLEYRFLREDGECVDLSYRGILEIDDRGAVSRVLSAVQDVSEYRRSRDAARQAEDLWRAFWTHAPEHVMIQDLEGTILEMNRAAFGLSDDQVLGASAFDFMTPRAADIFRKALSEARRTEEAVAYDLQIELDGEPSWWSNKLIPVRSAGGLEKLIVVISDVTLQRRAEIEHMEAARRAGMAEIATGVLHNIGNVLNGVSTSLSLLSEQNATSRARRLDDVVSLLDANADDLAHFFTEDPKGTQLRTFLGQLTVHLAEEREAARSNLERLHENLEHLRSIVDAQQSHAKSSGVERRTTAVELCEDALRICGASRPWRANEVQRDFAEIPPVYVDKHKILQILVNLIANARDAMDEAGVVEHRLDVATELLEGPARLRISVTDNGIGIPPESLPHVFEHGHTTKPNGHGFGLHSAALAAGELGGRVFAESDGHGCGACFTLEIPVEFT